MEVQLHRDTVRILMLFFTAFILLMPVIPITGWIGNITQHKEKDVFLNSGATSDKIYSIVGRSSYKRLYLISNGDELNLSISPGRGEESSVVGNDQSVSFFLEHPLNSDLHIDGSAILHLYIEPTVNMGYEPVLTISVLGGGLLGSNSIQVSSSQWYDIPINIQSTVTVGQDLELKISTNANLVDSHVTIKYNGGSTGASSYLAIYTDTLARPVNISTYNDNGAPQTEFNNSENLTVTALVKSPFGIKDISTVKISIVNPLGSNIIYRDPMHLLQSDDTTAVELYGYSMSLADLKGGTYTIDVLVTDISSLSTNSSVHFIIPSTVKVSPSSLTEGAMPGRFATFYHEVWCTVPDTLELHAKSEGHEVRIYIYTGFYYSLAFIDRNGNGVMDEGLDWINSTWDSDGNGKVDTAPLDANIKVKIHISVLCPKDSAFMTIYPVEFTAMGVATGDSGSASDILDTDLVTGFRYDGEKHVSGAPNSIKNVTVTLTNLGNAPDTPQLSEWSNSLGYSMSIYSDNGLVATDPDGKWATGFMNSSFVNITGNVVLIPIEPHKTENITFQFYIPPDSSFSDRSFFTCKYQSSKNTTYSDYLSFSLSVSRLEVNCNALMSGVPGQRIDYPIELKSHQQSDETMNITIALTHTLGFRHELYVDHSPLGILGSEDEWVATSSADKSTWTSIRSDLDQDGVLSIPITGGDKIHYILTVQIPEGQPYDAGNNGTISIQSSMGDNVSLAIRTDVKLSSALEISGSSDLYASPSSIMQAGYSIRMVGNMPSVVDLHVMTDGHWGVKIWNDTDLDGTVTTADQLLGYDSNSDGDFKDPLDSIGYDTNENECPDLGLISPLQNISLILQVEVPSDLTPNHRYTITLNFEPDTGGKYAVNRNIYIDNPPNINPIKYYYDAEVGVPVHFDLSGSTDADNDKMFFTWNFNDPYSSNNIAYGPMQSHTYMAVGHYTPIITVTDGIGNVTTSLDVTVKSSTQHPPVAVASSQGMTEVIVEVGNTALFSSEGSFDPDGDPITCHWDFDLSDNSSDDIQGTFVSHTFTEEGDYQVELKVVDPQGNIGTDIVTVHVRDIQDIPSPEVTVHLSGGAPCTANLTVSFTEGYDVALAEWTVLGPDGSETIGTGPKLSYNARVGGVYSYTVTAKPIWIDGYFSMSGHFIVNIEGDYPPYGNISLRHEIWMDTMGYYSTQVLHNLFNQYNKMLDFDYFTSVNVPLTFSNQGSMDPEGDIIESQWLLERMTGTEMITVQQGSGNEITINFPSAGYYKLSMTASDGVNINTTFVRIGVVDNFPPISVISQKNGSTLDEVPDGGCVYTTGHLALTAVNSYDVDSRYGTIGPQSLEYNWYLDNGQMYKGENLQIDLNAAGTYTLELVVSDGMSYSISSIKVVVQSMETVSFARPHTIIDIGDNTSSPFFISIPVYLHGALKSTYTMDITAKNNVSAVTWSLLGQNMLTMGLNYIPMSISLPEGINAPYELELTMTISTPNSTDTAEMYIYVNASTITTHFRTEGNTVLVTVKNIGLEPITVSVSSNAAAYYISINGSMKSNITLAPGKTALFKVVILSDEGNVEVMYSCPGKAPVTVGEYKYTLGGNSQSRTVDYELLEAVVLVLITGLAIYLSVVSRKRYREAQKRIYSEHHTSDDEKGGEGL